MRKYFGYFALIVALFAASVAGVEAKSVPSADTPRTIEQQVFKRIIGLPNYGLFDHIGYKVEGSTVTLYGKVLSLGTRKQAERAVARITGVERVVNNIENLPPSPFDDDIRRGIVREFANAPVVPGYIRGVNPSVRIIVENGRVTLEGFVNNRSTANYMGILANRVFGVFSVKNNLVAERDRSR